MTKRKRDGAASISTPRKLIRRSCPHEPATTRRHLPPAPPLPLTHANLRAHTAMLPAPRRTASPSKASSTSTKAGTSLAKAQQRLKCYNIVEPMGGGRGAFSRMDACKREIVDNVQNKPRTEGVDMSPNGKMVAKACSCEHDTDSALLG